MSIVVIGQGAWGTALGHLLKKAGQVVTPLHHGEPLPAMPPQGIVIALPAQSLRASLAPLRIPPATPLIIATKGIERSSGLLMPEVAAHIFPNNPIYMLSGPSFAEKVLAGTPVAMTLAGIEAAALSNLFTSTQCRVYSSADLLGVAVGGALKNVLAIACGIAVGAGYGENARAALFTRGLAEIVRFGLALGGRAETFLGLSGVGDMVLSCTSALSRNYAYGLQLGAGAGAQEQTLTEGVATAAAALLRAEKLGIEVPVIATVAAILGGAITIEDAAARLLERPGGKRE